jgi:hypothetical protein
MTGLVAGEYLSHIRWHLSCASNPDTTIPGRMFRRRTEMRTRMSLAGHFTIVLARINVFDRYGKEFVSV